ncbi:MAG: ATP-binding protein, partial [Thermoplasmata archaeon]|nr:ATP-binding protein [Thermoplasmata archaeon]
MNVREQFVEELENSLEKSFSKARENAPQFILLEKEPGATVGILENALRDIIMADDNRIWRADAAESIVPMFEQLLPESLKEIMRIDKPPRIELGLISNKAGMNMGTVQRGDSSLDPDIISAMMEAVRNFVKDSLSMHAGSEIVEKGIERFEMQGYTIMVCTGEIISLTLILSGSIDKSLIKEMQRVTKLIEDKYGSILEDWKGAMSELVGIEAPVSRTFFTSKKYEGEWDLGQLKLLQARMFDETLRIIESTAADRELVLLIENIDLADQSSTEQLKYIVRNLDDEKILFILTFNLAKDEGILQDTESLLESIDPYSPVRLRQKMDYDAGEKLTELFPDNLDMALFTLSHSVLLGSVDEHMISKSSGRSEEEVRTILETLRANNLVTGNLDGYLSNFVLGQLSEEKRFEITNEVVRSLEADRPSEILRIGELFIWLAGLDAEFSVRASDYARKIAEHHTRSFNLQGAIDMWLKAYMHERNQDSRMEDLVNIIKFEWLLSNVDEMKYYVDELLGMAESSGNKYYSGFALWNLARYCVRKGMFEEAIRYCDEAESCFKELGDLEHRAFVLNSKSTVYTHLGNRDKSLELQKEVLEVADTLN